jgi:hypothetical protein
VGGFWACSWEHEFCRIRGRRVQVAIEAADATFAVDTLDRGFSRSCARTTVLTYRRSLPGDGPPRAGDRGLVPAPTGGIHSRAPAAKYFVPRCMTRPAPTSPGPTAPPRDGTAHDDTHVAAGENVVVLTRYTAVKKTTAIRSTVRDAVSD